jgi:hypothetical protein
VYFPHEVTVGCGSLCVSGWAITSVMRISALFVPVGTHSSYRTPMRLAQDMAA